jgi:hypothetical protein
MCKRPHLRYISYMSPITPERIVELWPTLSPEARRQIAEIVQSNAGKDMPLDLSEEEEQMLAQARDDFKHGRALDSDEYHAEMSAFIHRLATKST